MWGAWVRVSPSWLLLWLGLTSMRVLQGVVAFRSPSSSSSSLSCSLVSSHPPGRHLGRRIPLPLSGVDVGLGSDFNGLGLGLKMKKSAGGADSSGGSSIRSSSIRSSSSSSRADSSSSSIRSSSSSSSSSSSGRSSSSSDIDGKLLNGFLRGHKCLFDDSGLSNGNMVFLLRGADSSQRYVTPLELETNRVFLVGADAALDMFDSRQQCVDAAKANVFLHFKHLREDDGNLGKMIAQDLERYHRVTQYGVAADLKANYLRDEVLRYNSELYDEVGMNFDALDVGVDSLKTFYSARLPIDQFRIVADCFDGLKAKLREMQMWTSSHGSHRMASRGPEVWEPPPEEGTLSKLLVDINNLNFGELTDDQQAEVKDFIAKRNTAETQQALLPSVPVAA